MWSPHFTSGHGLYRVAKIIVIPWNRLEDFVEGEQNNPDFPCKFTDALPSPGLNPLEGSTMCSCGKLGLRRRSRLLALERGRGAC